MGKEKVIGNKSDERWMEIAIHNEEMIAGFFGPYRPLSNFWPAMVEYDGDIYSTSENAYQAAKFASKDRDIFKTCSAGEAKKLSDAPHRLYIGENWNLLKLNVMEYVLRQKFSSLNPELVEFLIRTGSKKLIEANW